MIRPACRFAVALLPATCLLSVSVPKRALATDPAAAPTSLATCLERAEAAPALAAARAAIESAVASLAEARARGYPDGLIDARIEPTFARTGDPLRGSPSDRAIFPSGVDWGPLVSARLRVSWPIIQFGRVAAAKKRARATLLARAAAERATRAGIQMAVTEAYVAAAAAAEKLEEIDVRLVTIAELRSELEQLIEEASVEVSRRDVHRLDASVARLNVARIGVDKGRRMALARLKTLAGACRPLTLGEAMSMLPGLESDALGASEAVTAALARHPDLLSLRRLVEASEAAASLAVRSVWPVVRIGLDAGVRWAPHIENQSTPFSWDPWNGAGFGVGMSVHWKLQPGLDRARVERASYEAAMARATLRAAELGIARDVTASWNAAWAAGASVDSAEKAFRATRRLRRAVDALAAVGLRTPVDRLNALNALGGKELARIAALAKRISTAAGIRLATGADLRAVLGLERREASGSPRE